MKLRVGFGLVKLIFVIGLILLIANVFFSGVSRVGADAIDRFNRQSVRNFANEANLYQRDHRVVFGDSWQNTNDRHSLVLTCDFAVEFTGDSVFSTNEQRRLIQRVAAENNLLLFNSQDIVCLLDSRFPGDYMFAFRDASTGSDNVWKCVSSNRVTDAVAADHSMFTNSFFYGNQQCPGTVVENN